MESIFLRKGESKMKRMLVLALCLSMGLLQRPLLAGWNPYIYIWGDERERGFGCYRHKILGKLQLDRLYGAKH